MTTSTLDASTPATGLLQELELLVSRNRTAPSTETERQIIELRNRAFPELQAEPSGSLPDVSEIAPASGPVTEQDLVLDTPTAASLRTSFLFARGAALLPQALDTGAVNDFVTGIDRAFDAYDATADGSATPTDGEWFHPFDPPGGVRLRQDDDSTVRVEASGQPTHLGFTSSSSRHSTRLAWFR